MDALRVRSGAVQVIAKNPRMHDGIAAQLVLPKEANGLLEMTVDDIERLTDSLWRAVMVHEPDRET